MTEPPRDRRYAFDDVAESYDSSRPPYPEQLVNDLLSAAKAGPRCRILEVGCGPGLLTAALARSAARILALELGVNLAAVARRRLNSWSNVEVQLADFDRWSPPTASFDVVVIATAFHWLDSTQRVQKCRTALKSDGLLAIVDTHWGVGHNIGEFSRAVLPCYARWDPNHQPGFVPRTLGTLPSEHRELVDSGLFHSVHLKRYAVSRRYSSEQFCGLLNTYSDVRTFPPEARVGFLACVRDLIEGRFGGGVDRSDAYSLWLAWT